MSSYLIWAFVALLLVPGAVLAEIARVRGGEHEKFTRIVIESPSLSDWQFGRTGRGYGFSTNGSVTAYDLTHAFEKIPKSRVSDLWYDTDTGILQFTILCVCHAVAFEVRPGIIAIDLRYGEAPEGSIFEQKLFAGYSAKIGSEADLPPPFLSPPVLFEAQVDLGASTNAVLEYDWLLIAGIDRPPVPGIEEEEISDEVYTRLDPMRDALLLQVSRGIAQGLVEPGRPERFPENTGIPSADALGLRVPAGELPGIRARTGIFPGPNLTRTGSPCLPERLTDVNTWILDGSFSAARAGLLAEFDTPVSSNIIDAAKFYLSIGFGAEARQLISLLPEDQISREAVLIDLSFLTDLEVPPHGSFQDMESCDTSAALWAILALATTGMAEAANSPNKAAVTRSFSALTLEMRRHLGPTLVDYFLKEGDEATARRLQDAILRAPGTPGQHVELMQVGVELAAGNNAKAAEIAARVLEDPGSNAAAAAILVAESAFAGMRRVPPNLAAQLAALSGELRGGPDYLRIRRAQLLALAMNGEFQSAFDLLPEVPQALPDLWSIAAKDAPADLLLIQALRLTPVPETDRNTRTLVAQRLFEHGFAQEALLWLGPEARLETHQERLLAAGAALAVRDTRLAIGLLAGLSGDEAEALRARTALQLGNAEAAASLFRALGQDSAALRAEFWAGDWNYIADSDTAGLSAAARFLMPGTTTDKQEGLLARSSRLAAESGAAREAIYSLMQAVPQQFR